VDPREFNKTFENVLKEGRQSLLLEKLYLNLSGERSATKANAALALITTIMEQDSQNASELLSNNNKVFKRKSALLKSITHGYPELTEKIREAAITIQQRNQQDHYVTLQLISRLDAKDVADDRQLNRYAMFLCEMVKTHNLEFYTALASKWMSASSTPNPRHSMMIIQKHLLRAAQTLQSHVCLYFAAVLGANINKNPPYQDAIQQLTLAKKLCLKSTLEEAEKEKFYVSADKVLNSSLLQHAIFQMMNISENLQKQLANSSPKPSVFHIFRESKNPLERTPVEGKSYEEMKTEFVQACRTANISKESEDWIAAKLRKFSDQSNDPDIAKMATYLADTIGPRPSTPTIIDNR
jgi:hypothetical protein